MRLSIKEQTLFTVGRSTKWCNYCGNPCRDSSKTELLYDPCNHFWEHNQRSLYPANEMLAGRVADPCSFLLYSQNPRK